MVENLLCEMMRWKFSRRKFYDTVSSDQLIYEVTGGTIRGYDFNGAECRVERPNWTMDKPGTHWKGTRWWKRSAKTEEGEFLLTINKKKDG